MSRSTDIVVLGGARPTRPSMRPRLESALEHSVLLIFPEDRPPKQIADGAWLPPVADAALLAQADAQIGRLEDYLAPINPVRLTLRISTLLRQYWVQGGDDFSDELSLELWIDALAWAPEWAVAEAIAEWFANSRVKPTGADLVALCRERTADADVELFCLRRLVNPWEQEQARARQAEADAARQRAAEREAFNAANPDWTLGLPRQQRRMRPVELEPFDTKRHRAVLEELKKFRLRAARHRRVIEAMRQAGLDPDGNPLTGGGPDEQF